MKALRDILGVTLVVMIGFLFSACSNKKQSNTIINLPGKDSAQTEVKTTSAYDSLRKVALSTTATMLHLKLANDTTVYGVVMDWETNGGIVTIVSYADGDAGSYSSVGDEITGGKNYKSVRVAAKEFVSKAQRFLSKTKKTTDFSLPQKNYVVFYLLTNNGIFKGTENMKNFDNDTSPWQDLFSEGNEVSASLGFLKK